MRKNKRGGILGSTLSLFIATLIIVIILIVFIVLSGVMTAVDPGEFIIYSESDVGLSDIEIYFGNYTQFVELQGLLQQGRPLAFGLEKTGYKPWRMNHE